MSALRFAIRLLLGMLLPLAVQLWDRRRMRPEQREAAWNVASWGSALYVAGPLSMLAWCWVTRRAWRSAPQPTWRRALGGAAALLLGLLAAAAITAVILGVDYLVALALGVEP